MGLVTKSDEGSESRRTMASMSLSHITRNHRLPVAFMNVSARAHRCVCMDCRSCYVQSIILHTTHLLQLKMKMNINLCCSEKAAIITSFVHVVQRLI